MSLLERPISVSGLLPFDSIFLRTSYFFIQLDINAFTFFSAKIREIVALKAEQEVTFTFMLDGKNQASICLSNIRRPETEISKLLGLVFSIGKVLNKDELVGRVGLIFLWELGSLLLKQWLVSRKC